jgi:hypothetical protein
MLDTVASSDRKESAMLEDFKRALFRVQSDYGFYIDCQTNPAAALAGYDLTTEERATLGNPSKLADVLIRGIGVVTLRPITIKISGSHDWINRAATGNTAVDEARVADEVETLHRAQTADERGRSAFRLMGLIG